MGNLEDSDTWNTPATLLELVRRVMGAIDVDPASNVEAQAVVQATAFCVAPVSEIPKLSVSDGSTGNRFQLGNFPSCGVDGLAHEWRGRNVPITLKSMTVGARVAVVACSLFAAGGCSGKSCPRLCYGPASGSFILSCKPRDPVTVLVDGRPCNWPHDGGYEQDGIKDRIIYVPSETPGTCHVRLNFTSGFTFSTDVTFALTGEDECCPLPAIVPTKTNIPVQVPSEDCGSVL